MHLPKYTAVIRTLGKAGSMYQTLLDSLITQTHPPIKIFVYLAEGYPKPKETVGVEEIVYVRKGMVAQRALPYDEVATEWILFLDDDIAIEPRGVENMFRETLNRGANVCAFDAFPHHKLSFKSKIANFVLLSSIPRYFNGTKGYTVNFLGTDCYNPYPRMKSAWSTTNSGNGFLCRKLDFLKIHLENDLWLDEAGFAIPEDKVTYYKMHLCGLKILTYYGDEFVHLDAGSTLASSDETLKAQKVIKSSARNNYIFDYLYVKPNVKKYILPFRWLLKGYLIISKKIYYYIKSYPNKKYLSKYKEGLKEGKEFLSRIKVYK